MHELGHNLGMLHDFDPIHRGRSCRKMGFMSYDSNGGHLNQWSECSRTDLQALFNMIMKERKLNLKWCLSGKIKTVLFIGSYEI